jgi:cytochrome c biogenesis protein CcmG, thiol:disulfide interchange protein DsbE
MKKFLFLLPLILFLAITSTAISALKEQNQSKFSDKVIKGKNLKLPAFSLSDLLNQGSNFTEADLIKNNSEKLIILNFFASWCVSCVAEHENLINFQKNPNIEIYGIAWFDAPENTKKYLAENGNPYSKVGMDVGGKLAKKLGVTGTPESFVIKNGVVILHHIGPVGDEFLTQIYKKRYQ